MDQIDRGTQIVRSALFVPGDRPERFAKALAAGADQVIIDFEDAVEESAKAGARDSLQTFLLQNPEARVWVRINSTGHVQYQADVEFCSREPGVAGIMLPKAEDPSLVMQLSECGKPLWLIIETAMGAATLSLLSATPGVERLCFGSIDMAVDLALEEGTQGGQSMLNTLRAGVILHSKLNGLAPPLDGVYSAIADVSGLAASVKNSHGMGFGGVLCIHPSQIPVIHESLAPALEEVDWARRVREAAVNQSGAFKLDGRMIDAPVLARADRIISLASLSHA
ncbi:putative citrate lyase subunit beta [Pseudomonas sp. JV551A1]|uniref:HpcH/HpaI aldolase/citrate lyase family protein n=1 Tax=Pseudomonas sp. JV551A1 TaxID=2078787 RepID=UPI00100D39BF|nr:CoA ester lyase [Pseudomonas sp. JV551A1]SPO55778.1 putative citrate lyase subunit beta [Pseudomonas sp. JV551A1]